ncbi:hypothetical protein F2Q69_00035461 [Brassica cretica]|uniref:Uncharacterized protein n=1 Tax=Brassica cretica TaxID=69181 RepID=A0A8S9SDQ9_BRACR|nr:hypothetical protein F2Q69_00035461 [Brassica cretica]
MSIPRTPRESEFKRSRIMQLPLSIDVEKLNSIDARPSPSVDVRDLASIDTNVNCQNSWSFRLGSLSPEASSP